MTTKLLSLALVLSFAFIFSACTVKDQAKAKILNKIDQKIQEEKAELTDDQLLREIDSSSSSDVDTEFKKLETEIK